MFPSFMKFKQKTIEDKSKILFDDNYQEGGGGSGDFSVANVTVSDPNEYGIAVESAYVALADFIYDYDRTDTQLYSDEFETRQVIMYKGVAIMHFGLEVGENIEIEGDAERLDMGVGLVKVTGDCTITIAQVEDET